VGRIPRFPLILPAVSRRPGRNTSSNSSVVCWDVVEDMFMAATTCPTASRSGQGPNPDLEFLVIQRPALGPDGGQYLHEVGETRDGSLRGHRPIRSSPDVAHLSLAQFGKEHSTQ